MQGSGGTFDAVVIGGGLNGLAALFHLHRLGAERLALVEQFRLGHDRGSSHGHTRVMRSTYPDQRYVGLMAAARAEEWPRIETQIGRPLLHPMDGCFFGAPDTEFERYLEAVAGPEVERLDPKEARTRFPQFRFDNVRDVLYDHSSALIDAANTLDALAVLARRTGAEILEETRVTALRTTGHPIQVVTEGRTLEAERVVVAAGPWAGRLLPFLAPRLKVIRQTVAYFELDGPREECLPERFPIWAWIGPGDSDAAGAGFHYGLPEFGRPGVKVARHVTAGRSDDPDEVPGEDDDAGVAELRTFAEGLFARPIKDVVGTERCLYTCTPTEDFVMDRHPDDARITIGAGFSGHGFKFGPLTGRILAELCLNGSTTVEAFERERTWFRAKTPPDGNRSD